MGNYKSCFLKPSKPTAKLFDAHGHLRRVELPIKAAELMLDAPGNIVSPIEELRRSRRIQALRADEELQAGKLYLLFPTERVYCKVSELEMALIDAACRKKGMPRGQKVFPAMNEVVRGEKGEGVVRLLGEGDTGFPGRRLGNHRQWRPMLEPICEGT